MEIEVKAGQGLIQILADGFANCIQIRRVAAVNWYDNRGSVGEYYAAANLPEEQKDVLSEELNSALNEGDENRVLEQMEPFLNLFTSGRYVLNITPHLNADYEIHDNSKGWDGFSCCFYPTAFDYLSTIPAKRYSWWRIRHYLKRIKKGERPIALVYRHVYDVLEDKDGVILDSEYDSGYYILDGHHKLRAYKKAKVAPRVLFIEKREEGSALLESLFDQVEGFLNPAELRHMLINKPLLDYGNTDAGRKFNHALDVYLEHDSHISVEILELFLRALKEGSDESKTWLRERYAALERNFKKQGQVTLAYKKYIRLDTHQGLSWKQTSVRNQAEFEEWKKKLAKSL